MSTRRAAGREGLVLAVLCAAPFVLVLDTTIVTVALPSIGRDLGFSTATLHWVLASYALVFGGLLLLGGRLGDLFGRRRLFLAGAGLFAAASAAGGLAVAPWMLLAGRAVQGVGAAALMPAALALVTSVFREGPERDRALGIYSGVAALGAAAGVVLGGVLTQLLGWRSVLFAAVPIALTAFLLPATVADRRDHRADRQALDLPGAVTVTGALAALLYALSQTRTAGWAAATTLGPLAVGVVLLAAFSTTERRTRVPLVPLATFRIRPVTVANAAVLLESATTAYAVVLTLYFQQVLELSPLATGLCFLPLAVAAAVAAPVAGRLLDTFGGPKPAMLAALAVQAAGLLAMAFALTGHGVTKVIAATVVWAVGKVIADVAGTITATSGLGEDRKGLAAGLLSTAQQLGAACGLGVVAAVVAARGDALGGSAAGPPALIEALRWGLLAAVAFVALALVVVVAGLRRPSGSSASIAASWFTAGRRNRPGHGAGGRR
jgi:EmrB/QacA subfamily drug resistance transporter